MDERFQCQVLNRIRHTLASMACFLAEAFRFGVQK